MKTLKWEYSGGSGSRYRTKGSDSYEVKHGTNLVTVFDDFARANDFYESIEPKVNNESKALWQLVGGVLPELIDCHVAKM